MDDPVLFARRLAEHYEAIATLDGDEQAARDAQQLRSLIDDAERYRYLRGEGCMWYSGEHKWRSLYRLDHEVDVARSTASTTSTTSR